MDLQRITQPSDSVIDLSVVMPAHNSDKFIFESIERIANQSIKFRELVIVENGSVDGTSTEIERAIERLTCPGFRIRLIHSEKGLGNALRAGINQTNSKFVAFMADDLPFGFQELFLALEMSHTENSPDLVYLSKYLDEVKVKRNFARRLYGLIFRKIRVRILPMPVSDTQGSFVGLGDILRELNQYTREQGFLYTAELGYLLYRNNNKVAETPILSLDENRAKSTVHLEMVLDVIKGLFRIRKNSKSSLDTAGK